MLTITNLCVTPTITNVNNDVRRTSLHAYVIKDSPEYNLQVDPQLASRRGTSTSTSTHHFIWNKAEQRASHVSPELLGECTCLAFTDDGTDASAQHLIRIKAEYRASHFSPELLVEYLLLVFIGDRRGTSAQHLIKIKAEHRASLVPPELLGE